MDRLSQKEWKYLEVCPKEVCRDTQHMEEFWQDVIDKGGEGIILRDPLSPLEPGRSSGYLKHKVIPPQIHPCLQHIYFLIRRNSETLKPKLLDLRATIDGNANCTCCEAYKPHELLTNNSPLPLSSKDPMVLHSPQYQELNSLVSDGIRSQATL